MKIELEVTYTSKTAISQLDSALNGIENIKIEKFEQSSRLRPLNLSPSQIRTCGFPAYGSS